MGLSFGILLSLIFATAFVSAVDVQFKDCGSAEGNITKVEVEPCDNPAFCSLKKGTNPTISITFTPKAEATKCEAVVHGIVRGVPIPFPLPHPDACTQSGLTCPLKAGTSAKYSQQMEVKSEYPSLVVVVKWELKDQNNKDLACFMIKTRIVE